MARNLTGFYTQRRYLAAGVETAINVATPTDNRGSALVVTAGTYNELYAENLNIQLDRDFIARNGASPHPPGFRGVHGANNYDISFDVETQALAVSAATSHPNIYPILRTFCDAPTYDVGPPKKQTWKSAGIGYTPITLIVHEKGEPNATQNDLKTTFVSGLIDPTFKYPKNDRAMISCSFVPLTHTGPAGDDDSSVFETLCFQDTEGSKRLPIVCRGVTVSLAQHSSGGTLYAGHLVEAEIAMNLNPTRIQAASGLADGGVEVYYNTTENPSGTIRLIADDISTFDIYSLRDSETPLQFVITMTGPDGNTVRDWWYLQITGVKQGNEDAMKTWDLDVVGVYPDTDTSLAYAAVPHGASNYDAGDCPRSGIFMREYIA